ncbi:hypothetical protein SMMN14_08996 [Sphaerulina musiva]
MAVQITLEIPLDVAWAIRDIDYDLERIDGDVELTLGRITTDIIEAIKALPQANIPRPDTRFSSSTSASASLRDISETGSFSSSSHSFSRIDSSSSSQWPNSLRSSSSTSSSTTSNNNNIQSLLKYETTSDEDDKNSLLLLPLQHFPEFDLYIENEFGSHHHTLATGDMTIADLEIALGPLCGFEPTWQSLLWRGYRINRPCATLFMYGIHRYPYMEIRRRSPPEFEQQLQEQEREQEQEQDYHQRQQKSTTATATAAIMLQEPQSPLLPPR